MIEIILLDRQHNEVARLPVPPDVIAEAACVKYEGRYFIFQYDGSHYLKAQFIECKPPVELTRN